jgi:F-type H+-transporting ATPase subunit c
MRIVNWVLLVTALCLVASPALAAEGDATNMSGGLIALGAGIGMGLAAFGVGLGQGRATAAARESIGRNPNSADRLFTPFILGLALMEALALYTLVIAFILQGKIG